jgi:hypothetical protein
MRVNNNPTASSFVASQGEVPRAKSKGRLNLKNKSDISSLVNAVVTNKLTKERELKYIRTTLAVNSAVSTTAVIQDLTSISLGDTDTTREGDQVTVTNLQGIMVADIATSDVTADDTNTIRVIIFQWYSATTPTAAEILENPVGADHVTSFYRHDTRFQYNILYDELFSLSRNGPANLHAKFEIKSGFRPKIQYIAGSSFVGQNKIYILYVSDSGAIEHPGLGFTIKTSYHDS